LPAIIQVEPGDGGGRRETHRREEAENSDDGGDEAVQQEAEVGAGGVDPTTKVQNVGLLNVVSNTFRRILF
jgi:hypothetical protein